MDDARTNDELFKTSLVGDYEDEAAWDAVGVLRRRGTKEVFDLAAKYCQSEDPKERARGLDVLAQLGARVPPSDRPYRNNCVSIAIDHLKDASPLVIHSAAWALSRLDSDRAVAALIAMRNDSDPGVRHAVACGMAGHTQPEAISTLIELMDDASDEVRDWATFGLGSLCDEDTPEIRDALRKRLDDSSLDARNEAIWGLAQRKDPGGLELLLEHLESESWIQGDEDAAANTLGLNRDTEVDELCNGLRRLLGLPTRPVPQ